MGEADRNFTLTHRTERVDNRPGRETFVLSHELGSVQAYRDPIREPGYGAWLYGLAFHLVNPDSRGDIGVERECEWTETGTCFTHLDGGPSVSAILSAIFERPDAMRAYLQERFLTDLHRADPRPDTLR